MSTHVVKDYTATTEGLSELIGSIQAAKGLAKSMDEMRFCCQIENLMHAMRAKFKELPPPGTYTRVGEAKE